MKLFIAALLASSLISPAVAGDYYEEMMLCAVKAQTANGIMDARQAGVSMDTMNEIVASQGLHSTDAAYANEMVLAAYALKREHAEEDKRRVIDAFQGVVYLHCTRELRESK